MLSDTVRGSYVHLVPSVFSFIVFLSLAIVSVLRGRKNATNLLFAGICFLGGLINLDIALVGFIHDKTLALRIDRLIYFFFVFSVPLYIKFVHSFLGISGKKWVEGLSLVFSSAFCIITPSEIFITGLEEYSFGRVAKVGPAYHIFMAFGACATLYCLYILVGALGTTRESYLRNRIKYILGGMGVTTILLLMHYLPVSGIGILSPGSFIFVPALILAYGILKYNILDFGIVVRKGTVYLVLTGTLAALYILVIYVFHSLFLIAGHGNTIAFPLFFASLIVILFDPIKRKTQEYIDRVLFRGMYDYQKVLKEISGKMTSLLKLDEIAWFLVRSVSEAMRAEHVRLFIRSVENESYREQKPDATTTLSIPGDHPLIGYLERNAAPVDRSVLENQNSEDRGKICEMLEGMKSTLVIPLFSKNELLGFLSLGEKRSGELFVREDIELLTTVANQSSVAIDNARNYSEVESLNRDLEKRIEERTADLARAVEEKDRARERLIRSESLAAIGQLVAGTAHEMNNPLSSVSSLIQTSVEELIRAGRPEDGDIIDDLQFSLKELRRAKGIIESLLGLSRQNDSYTEPVDIHSAIDDALRVLYNQYKHMGLNIIKKYEEALPLLEGNFAGLGQLFINVLKNAIQAVNTNKPSETGQIIIETHSQLDPCTISISIRDNGGGIPAASLKDIFKPFFTTKEVGKGTGLGLYISHEIVKKHRGEIHVESEEGRGSVFRIELPISRESLH